MQTDDDIGKIAQATPLLIGKAMEMFLARLCQNACAIATSRLAKTITASHLKAYVHSDEMMDFLKETVSSAADLSVEGEEDGPKLKRQRTLEPNQKQPLKLAAPVSRSFSPSSDGRGRGRPRFGCSGSGQPALAPLPSELLQPRVAGTISPSSALTEASPYMHTVAQQEEHGSPTEPGVGDLHLAPALLQALSSAPGTTLRWPDSQGNMLAPALHHAAAVLQLAATVSEAGGGPAAPSRSQQNNAPDHNFTRAFFSGSDACLHAPQQLLPFGAAGDTSRPTVGESFLTRKGVHSPAEGTTASIGSQQDRLPKHDASAGLLPLPIQSREDAAPLLEGGRISLELAALPSEAGVRHLHDDVLAEPDHNGKIERPVVFPGGIGNVGAADDQYDDDYDS